MKCLYYLAPTLKETHRISDDLHEAGVSDWFLHVVSRDEAGLKNERLHSSNYLETLDVVREGAVGAAIGFALGIIGIALLRLFEPFGPDVPGYVYPLIVAVATLFGAWEGGFLGVNHENQKLRRFRDDLDAGKHLLLVYVRRDQGDTIKSMMAVKHPQAEHVATDRHFINPFAAVRRKQGNTQTPAAS